MLRWRVGTPSWLNPQRVATPKNTTSSCGLYLCRYPIIDQHMIRLLKALRQTVPEEEQYVFWDAVHRFSDMDMFFSTISIRTWGWYFQLQFVDSYDICTKVFGIFTGTVAYGDPTPPCPLCGGATTFELDASKAFSCWYRRAARRPKMSSKERRKRNVRECKACCRGSVVTTSNTWLANSKLCNFGHFLPTSNVSVSVLIVRYGFKRYSGTGCFNVAMKIHFY